MVRCKRWFDSKAAPTGNHEAKRRTNRGAQTIYQGPGGLLRGTDGGKGNLAHSIKREICSGARGMDICKIKFWTAMCKPGSYLRTTKTWFDCRSGTTDAGGRCNQCTCHWFTKDIGRSIVPDEYGWGKNTCNPKTPQTQHFENGNRVNE